MTFLNDIWKKFKVDPSSEKHFQEHGDVITQEPMQETPTPEAVYQALEHHDLETEHANTLFGNLQTLKNLLDQPKEETPELRFSTITKHLGVAESHETVRQERWPHHIHCPACHSTNLKQLPQLPPKSLHNHRYQCLDCDYQFDDDTDTPMEHAPIPLQTWMQCWYLLGCTDSLTYIAHKLGLDLITVERMVRHLQKTFNAQKPLTQFMGYTTWNKQVTELRNQLKEDLLKQSERLDANVATAPKDTTEFRRQQNLRRTLDTTPKPASPNVGKKR